MEAGDPETPPGRCSPRDLLSTGPGPDAGGSNQGSAGWLQTPDMAAIDAASAPLAVCARVVAVTSVTSRRGIRRRAIPASHSSRFARYDQHGRRYPIRKRGPGEIKTR